MTVFTHTFGQSSEVSDNVLRAAGRILEARNLKADGEFVVWMGRTVQIPKEMTPDSFIESLTEAYLLCAGGGW
jgi:hypothetical protein